MASDSTDQSTPSPLAVTGNAEYVDQLYNAWSADSGSVPREWQLFFSGFDFAADTGSAPRVAQGDAQARVDSLIFAYRNLGHMIAQVDPLGEWPTSHPELEIEAFGLSSSDLDTSFDPGHLHLPRG